MATSIKKILNKLLALLLCPLMANQFEIFPKVNAAPKKVILTIGGIVSTCICIGGTIIWIKKRNMLSKNLKTNTNASSNEGAHKPDKNAEENPFFEPFDCDSSVTCKIPPAEIPVDTTIQKFSDFLENTKAKVEKQEKQNDTNICNEEHLIPVDELIELINTATSILKKEPTMLELCGEKFIVVGDIHGDFSSLYAILNEKYIPELKTGTKILFLGDYVDRGNNSVEVMATLLKLKTLFPQHVYLIRGNHEVKSVNCNYGNLYECTKKYPNLAKKLDYDHILHDNFNKCFEYLPLVAIINKKSFCVHGGICRYITSLDVIKNIQKPIIVEGEGKKEEEIDIVNGLLWSDPSPWNNYPTLNSEDFNDNCERGIGDYFEAVAAKKFLQKNNFNQIIRAHQTPQHDKGYEKYFNDNTCITVFSSARYPADGLLQKENDGAILQIQVDKSSKKQIITAMPFFKDKNQNYKVVWKNTETVK